MRHGAVDDLLAKNGANSELRLLLHQVFSGRSSTTFLRYRNWAGNAFFDANQKWTTLRGGNDRLANAFATGPAASAISK